jgi:hypothetical protein
MNKVLGAYEHTKQEDRVFAALYRSINGQQISRKFRKGKKKNTDSVNTIGRSFQGKSS